MVVNLDPSRGSEQNKTRPAVVVSSDVLNRSLETLIVVPISSLKPGKTPYRHEVFIRAGEGGLLEDSVAQPIQIRTIDRSQRVTKILGQLPAPTMAQLGASMFGVLGGL